MDQDVEKRVIEMASVLFLRSGIRTITMDYIAAEAGISKRTLYEMFKDKDTLLQKTIEYGEITMQHETEELEKQCSNIFELSIRLYGVVLRRLQNMNRNYMSDLKRYHPKVSMLLEKNKKRNMLHNIELMERGKCDGFIRPELNSEVMTRLLYAQFELLMNYDDIINGRFTFAEVFEMIVINYTRGISTPKGLELLEKHIK